MTSHRSHSGRMNVSDKSGKWVATLKAQSQVFEIVLNAVNAESAILQAEQLYADLRAVSNPKPYCWQCLHWKLLKSECSLGFAEGRSSGGRFASQCSAFWPDD